MGWKLQPLFYEYRFGIKVPTTDEIPWKQESETEMQLTVASWFTRENLMQSIALYIYIYIYGCVCVSIDVLRIPEKTLKFM